jgi:hypothetical protein
LPEVKAITEALQAVHSVDNPYLVVQANRMGSLPLEARGPLWMALTEAMSGAAGHAQKDGAVAYPPASTEDEDESSVPEFNPFG